MIRAAMMGWLMAVVSGAWAVSAVFVNPGRSDEGFWVAAAQAMAAAADQLGVRFEVRYAERDPVRALRQVRDVARLPPAERPDYLLITNDNGTVPEMLRTLDGHGIRVLVVFSGVYGRARDLTGAPRTRYPFWLGSLEPDAEQAGYLIARALIERGRREEGLRGVDGKLPMLAFGGDRATPTARDRDAGLRRAIAEAGDVRLLQQVYGDWRREKAAYQARVLYRRYPLARLVWAANDQMAFGAMQAWRDTGGRPGRDAWFATLNTSADAFAALRDGELEALAGGHVLTGALGLVLVYDHAHGYDFAREGLELRWPMFVLFDRPDAVQAARQFAEPGARIDFRAFSRAWHGGRPRAPFDLKQLIY
ncbi:MAG: ABC transporter substrate-binding protein [Burkholderiaceae bacterium]